MLRTLRSGIRDGLHYRLLDRLRDSGSLTFLEPIMFEWNRMGDSLKHVNRLEIWRIDQIHTFR